MAAASAAAGDLDALGGRLLVDVVEVEVLVGASSWPNSSGSGRPAKGSSLVMRARVTAPSTRRVDAFGGEVGGGGAGCVRLADKDAEADGAGAGFFEGFDLAEADARGELVAFVDDGFGVGGSGFEGASEDVLRDFS